MFLLLDFLTYALRLCLRVWRGMEGKAWKKKEGVSGKNREHRKEGL